MSYRCGRFKAPADVEAPREQRQMTRIDPCNKPSLSISERAVDPEEDRSSVGTPAAQGLDHGEPAGTLAVAWEDNIQQEEERRSQEQQVPKPLVD